MPATAGELRSDCGLGAREEEESIETRQGGTAKRFKSKGRGRLEPREGRTLDTLKHGRITPKALHNDELCLTPAG